MPSKDKVFVRKEGKITIPIELRREHGIVEGTVLKFKTLKPKQILMEVVVS